MASRSGYNPRIPNDTCGVNVPDPQLSLEDQAKSSFENLYLRTIDGLRGTVPDRLTVFKRLLEKRIRVAVPVAYDGFILLPDCSVRALKSRLTKLEAESSERKQSNRHHAFARQPRGSQRQPVEYQFKLQVRAKPAENSFPMQRILTKQSTVTLKILKVGSPSCPIIPCERIFETMFDRIDAELQYLSELEAPPTVRSAGSFYSLANLADDFVSCTNHGEKQSSIKLVEDLTPAVAVFNQIQNGSLEVATRAIDDNSLLNFNTTVTSQVGRQLATRAKQLARVELFTNATSAPILSLSKQTNIDNSSLSFKPSNASKLLSKVNRPIIAMEFVTPSNKAQRPPSDTKRKLITQRRVIDQCDIIVHNFFADQSERFAVLLKEQKSMLMVIKALRLLFYYVLETDWLAKSATCPKLKPQVNLGDDGLRLGRSESVFSDERTKLCDTESLYLGKGNLPSHWNRSVGPTPALAALSLNSLKLRSISGQAWILNRDRVENSVLEWTFEVH